LRADVWSEGVIGCSEETWVGGVWAEVAGGIGVYCYVAFGGSGGEGGEQKMGLEEVG